MPPHILEGSPMAHRGLRPVSYWSSGLCNCTSDCSSCCLTMWCPCISFGRISEIVDHGGTKRSKNCSIYSLLMTFLWCHWIYSSTYRSKMRSEYNIPKTPCCTDCLVHCFCEQCSLCQMYRELQSRGFDLSVGWEAQSFSPRQVPTMQGMIR